MDKIKDILIVVPTYWIFSNKKEIVHKGYELYDHPTELSRYQTLSRLLKSIKKVDFGSYNIKIAILVASPRGIGKYGENIKGMAKEMKGVADVFVIFERDLLDIRAKLEKYPSVEKHLTLREYSNVRNAALMVAGILDQDAILFLDDDVVIADNEYLLKIAKAVESKGRDVGAGVYVDVKGDYGLGEQMPWWKQFWNKNRSMNKVLGCPTNTIDTIMLGGNSIITKKTFQKVPFDPWIMRGEDIDYAFNGSYFGFNVCMDNDIKVVHLPPTASNILLSAYWSKLRSDVFRFRYKREKLKTMGVDIATIPEYPRVFLGHSMVPRAILTAFFLAIDSLVRRDFESAKENFINIKKFIWDVGRYAKKHKCDYLKFQKEWESALADIGGDKGLQEIIQGTLI